MPGRSDGKGPNTLEDWCEFPADILSIITTLTHAIITRYTKDQILSSVINWSQINDRLVTCSITGAKLQHAVQFLLLGIGVLFCRFKRKCKLWGRCDYIRDELVSPRILACYEIIVVACFTVIKGITIVSILARDSSWIEWSKSAICLYLGHRYCPKNKILL